MRNDDAHASILHFDTITSKKSGSGARTCRHDNGNSETGPFRIACGGDSRLGQPSQRNSLSGLYQDRAPNGLLIGSTYFLALQLRRPSTSGPDTRSTGTCISKTRRCASERPYWNYRISGDTGNRPLTRGSGLFAAGLFCVSSVRELFKTAFEMPSILISRRTHGLCISYQSLGP